MIETQLKNLKFDAFGDGSAFILGEHHGENQEDSFCYGVDIPIEDDAKWRFWKMYDDETISWNLTGEEKELYDRLYNMLNEIDDVTSIYTNVKED